MFLTRILTATRHGAPDPKYRGTGGPVFVQPAPDPNPIAPAMVEGASSIGIPTFESNNGRMMEADGGASILDLRVRDGKRLSVFRSYNSLVGPFSSPNDIVHALRMAIDVLAAHARTMFSLTPNAPTCIRVGMLEAEKDLRRGSAEPRDPVRTRQRLLQAAFQEVYHSGFQGSDLEAILDRAGVTKGALYHHFENKEALGYAVVDEVITTMMRDKWLRPLEHAKNPIDALARIVQSTSTKPEWLRRGCPINNLAQEMSPLDEGFRKRLAKVFGGWHDGIAAALREGQKRGLVRSDVDPNERAIFLVAVYEGYLSLAKNSQDARVLRAGKRILILHLESLRPSAGQNRAPSPRQ